MKKRKKGRKLGRERGQRRALYQQLAGSLVLARFLVTSEAKARELRPLIEKFVSRAREATVVDRRLLRRYLTPIAVRLLCNEIAPKFLGRSGGYTRIIKLPMRKSDGVKMARIEFV